MAPGERVLLEEACRLADRLDVLDRLLAGDGVTWGRIRGGRDDDAPSTLIINAAVGEARMGAGELRQLVRALAAPAAEAEAPPVPSGVGSILAKQQEKKRAAGGKR